MNSPPYSGQSMNPQQFNSTSGGQFNTQGQMQYSGTSGGNQHGPSTGSNTNSNKKAHNPHAPFPPAGNWNHPPPPFLPPSLHTPPPCGQQSPFSQPPPPCFPPGAQQFARPPPGFPHQNCHNNGPPPPLPPPPPQQGGGPQQNRHPRNANNVWSDPSLYQPNLGAPRHQHPNQFGFGRGGGPSGWGQNRGGGGGRWNNRGRGGGGGPPPHHQQQGGNSFNNGKGQNTKKVKIDKRDCPENNLFHCETCDRGFKTEEKHKEHVSEHKKCWVEGCRYVAAPKLVELHFNTQHRTGLAKRIWSLESPEDIEKWIQERKRNFPTKENVARKLAEAAERQSRGEVLETKQFGKMRGRGGRGRGGKRGRFGRHQGHWNNNSQNDEDSDNTLLHPTSSLQQAPQSQSVPQTEDQSKQNIERQGHPHTSVPQSPSSSDGSHTQLPPGDTESDMSSQSHKRPFSSLADAEGETNSSESSPSAKKAKENPDHTDRPRDTVDPLSLLIEGKSGIGEDDESDADGDNIGDVKQEMLSKGLGLTSLISSYDSDSKDEDSDKDVAVPTKPPPEFPSPQPIKSPAVKDSAPKHKPRQPQQPSAKGPTKKQPQKGNRYGRKSSLLEMLLANEIRHERNVILQCVHYIIKNNFLGVREGGTQADG